MTAAHLSNVAVQSVRPREPGNGAGLPSRHGSSAVPPAQISRFRLVAPACRWPTLRLRHVRDEASQDIDNAALRVAHNNLSM